MIYAKSDFKQGLNSTKIATINGSQNKVEQRSMNIVTAQMQKLRNNYKLIPRETLNWHMPNGLKQEMT